MKWIKGGELSIKTSFNEFQDSYKERLQSAISFISRDVDYFTEVKARYLCKIAEKYLGNPRNLCALDFGCGVGLTDYFLVKSFGRLYGVDISEGVINRAAVINPTVNYQVYDGKQIPFYDNSMDVFLPSVFCIISRLQPGTIFCRSCGV